MQKKTIHFIGIGGISMSGIAEIMLSCGYNVTGSDINESKIIEDLKSKGAQVFIGHHPELIKDADIVVYTAAIKENDPERQEALKLKKSIYERAEFLGQISKEYKNAICISGTHGKSTTTGMVSSIFLEANKKPTIQIGAILPEINGNTLIGGKEFLIMEACEYVDSFLYFHPTSEIILNIDNDHLDYFKNIENIKKSFTKYLNLLPNDGAAIVNIDDANINDIIKDTDKTIITYGINNKANFNVQNITKNNQGFYSFEILKNGNHYLDITLNINGYHNIYNALAAIALADSYKIKKEFIKKGLETYRGVDRRFQFLGKYNDAYIYDDYAHHPTEIKATVEISKSINHHESWGVFQAHTFSRTYQHLDEFAKVLSNFDHIVIAPIYPARETNIYGVSEEQLVDKIKENNVNVIYLDNFLKIENYLKDHIKPNDLVITIGAGPINQVGYNLVKESQD